MLFNSIEYFYFFIIVYSIYWVIGIKRTSYQNLLLLIASYIFYAWWDYRFLSLIFISSLIDYFLAQMIYTTHKSSLRKIYLTLSLTANLGFLAFFKYFNFFIDSWIHLLSSVGYQVSSTTTLSIILPVGISFYTFQTLSYTIDVYQKNLKPSKSFINFATFVALFPQLVAGPIERAKNLLPQIEQSRVFSKETVKQGLSLIIWGLFKSSCCRFSCTISR